MERSTERSQNQSRKREAAATTRVSLLQSQADELHRRLVLRPAVIALPEQEVAATLPEPVATRRQRRRHDLMRGGLGARLVDGHEQVVGVVVGEAQRETEAAIRNVG